MSDLNSLKDIIKEQQLSDKLKSEMDYKMTLEFVSKRKLALSMYHNMRKDLREAYIQKNISCTENELDVLAFNGVLAGVSTKAGYVKILESVATFKPQMSLHEQHFWQIAMDMANNDPDTVKGFFCTYELFPAILYKEGKGADNCLDRFSKVLKEHPLHSLELVLECFNHPDSYPSDVWQRLDKWLFGQLANVNFKKYKNDVDFVEPLTEYLNCCSTDTNAVNQLVCRKMDVFDEKRQNQFWNHMLKFNFDSDKAKLLIQTFLSLDHNDLTNRIFYRQFNDFPKDFRAKILGELLDNEQKRYLQIVKKQGERLDTIKIKNPMDDKSEFLLWHLYDKGKIQDKEVFDTIQKQDLKKRSEAARQFFLFADKKAVKGDVFLAGCQKVKDSVISSLMWLNSFKNVPSFASYLAATWMKMPTQIRQSKNIQLAMDKRYALIYQLAQHGDTSALNEIKQSMKDDYTDFIKRLSCPYAKGDTAIHQLCRQGKKGILKLLEYLPKEKQNALLNQKNEAGQTPLDLASEDFRRYLDQKSFVRPKEEQFTEEIVPEVKKEETVQVLPQKEEKPLRPFVLAGRYKADKKKFENNPNVLKGMEDKIKELRSLSDVELNLRSKKESKIAFKSKMSATGFSANGNVYRLGYIVQDGVIGVLFVMTHQQYDNELKTKGQLDKNAQNFRHQIHSWRTGNGGNPGH